MANSKILAIKFKYLGDVAVAVPALRALREQCPEAALHCLVAEEAVPLIEHLPWLDRVWGLPRTRGRVRLRDSLPILVKLRAERFDISVDFVGNDRGAIISRFIASRRRIGVIAKKGFFGRTRCYTNPVPEAEPYTTHESERDVHILTTTGFNRPSKLDPELHVDTSLRPWAQEQMPEGAILCHLTTSTETKEWPLEHWLELITATDIAPKFVFTAGPSEREQSVLQALKQMNPAIHTLTQIPDLAHFMVLIERARAIVCGDTVAGHIAAGVDTPALVLFGPSVLAQWNPRGKSICLQPDGYNRPGHPTEWETPPPPISSLPVQRVLDGLYQLLDTYAV